MKKIAILFICTIFLIYFIGCEEQEKEEIGYGFIKFINASPSQEEVSFSILDLYDGNFYYVCNELAYGEEYGYYRILNGTRIFSAYPTGSSVSMATGDSEIEIDKLYTVLTTDFGTSVNPKLIILENAYEVPTVDKAYLRVFHGSTGAGEIDIFMADSTKAFSGLNRYEATPYKEFSPETYTFSAYSTENQQLLLEFPSFSLDANKVYTIILSGSSGGVQGTDLNAKIYGDANEGT